MQPLRLPALVSMAALALALPARALQEAETAATEGGADAPAEAEAQKEEKKEAPPARERVDGELPWEWSRELEWRSLGPANMGGRITSIAGHPTDSSTYWVGTAGGGLLKTVNRGFTYEHQFQDQNTSSIGAVAVAPSDAEIVWVGTGENNPRNSVSWGDGVYKSLDGGASWWHVGLPESFQISTILIHPDDPNVVFVGALGRLWGPNEERGLFKTTDGGATWEKVLYVDDKTGVIDARMKPDDPNTLLVATYERERDLYDSNDPSKKWGPGSGLHRSTDGGATWTEITAGLPTVTLGRIGLSWYAADPNVVFAIVESERITQEPEDVADLWLDYENGADVGARVRKVTEEGPAAAAELREGDLILRLGEQTILNAKALTEELKKHRAGDTVQLEIVRGGEARTVSVTLGKRPPREGDASDELGYPRPGPYSIGLGGQRENVEVVDQGDESHEYGGVYRSDDAGLTWTRINSVNPRPMYYSEIRVDPSDSNYVYVLGTSLYRSSDGGVTFTADGHDDSVHVDHHALWIDPRDGRHIVLGNDGGIYVTHDRMAHWDHHNHVAIGQFYDIAVDGRRDYKVYGGLQDNGTWGGPGNSRTGGTINEDWVRIGGGDGFVCAVDAEDPDLVYSESQNGGMGRRNMRTGEGGFIRPRSENDVEYRFNWKTPFLLSAHNSRIHYSAGNYVFKSLDRGNGGRRISPEITRTDRGSATALAESPSSPDVLYVGTDDGALWTTRDGGTTWIDLFALNEGLEAEAKPQPKAEPRAATVAWTPREARTQEPEASTPAAPVADDPLSGTWSCKATGPGIDSEDAGRFTLTLALGEEGALTGTLDSEIGKGPIEGGRFDAEKREVSFRFPGETFTLAFKADLKKDGTLDGEIVAAGGAYSFDFEGERTEAAAGAVTGAAQKKKESAEAKQEKQAEEPPATEAEAEAKAEAEGDAQEEESEKAPAPRKFKKNTIDQLLPKRCTVSSIVASQHKKDRVYVTFDGHRSDDDAPYAFVSDDEGETWKSLTGKLPRSVGSVRVLKEDPKNRDLLYLGTEFRALVSIDGGATWTELGGNLPTVAVHDFEFSEAAGEVLVGTHGRSIWALDITPLREMSEKSIDADAFLYPVSRVATWRFEPERGSTTRRFVGQSAPRAASIFYSLDKKPKEIRLDVVDASGEVVRELEASPEKGLHKVVWDLRRGRTDDDAPEGRRRFRRGRGVGEGTYTVVLTVDGEKLETPLVILGDPAYPADPWAEEEE